MSRCTVECDPHLDKGKSHKIDCHLNERDGPSRERPGQAKVLDSRALNLPLYSKGLKISSLFYFSLVLISEQTKDSGVFEMYSATNILNY